MNQWLRYCLSNMFVNAESRTQKIVDKGQLDVFMCNILLLTQVITMPLN